MARKRHSDEDILKLLREIEVKLSNGSDVQSACRGVGISDATYDNLRKRFGGMGRSQLSEMRSLEKENTRLKKIVTEAMQDWLARVGIKPIRIYPGSPWENGYNERFNATLRREVLNAEWFTRTKQAQIVINQWLRQYNYVRPHQALNMRPPVPETLIRNGTEPGG